jgi:hypothetical protein
MKRFAVILVLLILPLLLPAQEQPSTTAEQLTQISLDFEIAIEILKQGLESIKSELSTIYQLSGEISSTSETALERSGIALSELSTLAATYSSGFSSLSQQVDSLESSFTDYKQKVKEEMDKAFEAQELEIRGLKKQVNRYQMILFSGLGLVAGAGAGYLIGDVPGALIGGGVGVGSGILLSLVL